MKITELFSVQSLKEMKLIAGETGKEREITTINMMDAPDIIPFLNPNEFLVTTAYHIKDQPDRLLDLIQAMANRGCAALGIKTKRFLHEVPKEALTLANKLALPIIELPYELSLGEIVNQTLRAILDHRAGELASALEIHKHFTSIIMQGKGIHSLLEKLSQLTQRSVHLVDHHLMPIAEPCTQLEIFSSLKSDLDQDIRHLALATNRNLSFSVISTKETHTLFPVNMSEKKSAFLILTGSVSQENHLAVLTIEQAINVLSFALMKEHALRQHERRIRNDFFLQYLDGAFTSNNEIINRAKEYSLPNDTDYLCVAGKLDNENNDHMYTQRKQTSETPFEFIEDMIHRNITNVHFFTKNNTCILLFEMPTQQHELVLQTIQEKVAKTFEQTISFGVSNLCYSFIKVQTAYQEAVEALSQGERSKKISFIQHFQTKDLTELLRLIPEKEMSHFYNYTFKDFSTCKPEEKESLLQTLFVYLETHCQISETAKRLFIHRNTVVYRIDKCEELLGRSLKDPEATLQLRVAFQIQKLLAPRLHIHNHEPKT
ncbi:PucR family transcriptional regulator [Mesobacillus maritimus]|uniref:PucR family transcriptional regulator ligand-binding domain-containing protein n=1 Tax=Mesobacillus maritimus TaxID=1643336 RepID=A0ABS7K0N5_9BACI|nr:PucR family transcriptional regulator [Mesobacillus maritimus]MBY0095759.1 PucR family transcriptional regulator ligand-binding domain-containing protein [Mesobacillus maritimus]